jgi:hypothetical protein
MPASGTDLASLPGKLTDVLLSIAAADIIIPDTNPALTVVVVKV